MSVNMDELIAEVAQQRGCKLKHIKNPEAQEFVARVTKMKQEGKEPNIARAAELLLEKWGIEIKDRAFNEHARGKCSCLKK
ncbi:hypothetical protein GTO27_06900 [Candidatus Bathyarchaeota archaeon]|nr:hypothetical protein [Candidatus Bathyarchaeota archaeon]